MYSSTPPARKTENRLHSPSAVRYIKLGRGGGWASAAFEQHIVPFGFSQVPHEACAAADWDKVGQLLVAAGRTKAGVTQGLRELQEFYGLDGDALWVTFADRHLYWTFAEPEVISIEAPSAGSWQRFRRCIGGWSRHSCRGEPLSTSSLSSALTRVAGFRQTICAVERRDYLLRRLRAEEEPLLKEARHVRAELERIALAMIVGLDWRDFEIMVDLLFARGGAAPVCTCNSGGRY